MSELTIIGRVEKVTFPTVGKSVLHARIDTGAKTSSLWASEIAERTDGLHVRLVDDNHDAFKTPLVFKHYSQVVVSNSTGHEQTRYKVKLPIIIKKRHIMATFTLADRSTQVYPVLIGRSTLNRKFMVDVSRGTPLKDEEQQRSELLQGKLKEGI